MTSELLGTLVQTLTDGVRTAQPAGTLIVKSPDETVRMTASGIAGT